MIRELFINAAIILSFTFIWGQITRDTKVSEMGDFAKKVLLGTACGFLGSLLIFFAIKTTPGVYIDLRTLAPMIAVAYGGFTAGVISGTMIVSTRMIFFGVSTASLAAASNLVLIIMICFCIAKLRINNLKKWILMLALNIAVVIVTIYLLLIRNTASSDSVFPTLLALLTAMIIVGMITYYAVEYILRSNALFLQFKEQSSKDFLTGLNNIRQFDSAMNEYSLRVHNNSEKLSLLLIDIDFFKKVNDTYGHAAGDAVLKQLGTVLTETCRSFDIISRNGGEEFSVLLPDCPHDQALEVAERVRQAVRQYKFVLPDNKVIGISISIGVSTYPDTLSNLQEILHQADGALYKAKRTGRNKVCSIDECIEL
ncbi:MAG: diguanylate cyclase [Clostridia bacterium]|nr:diguanylate cyclase [Clostridia bacterium]